jgi:hypothetical protein
MHRHFARATFFCFPFIAMLVTGIAAGCDAGQV